MEDDFLYLQPKMVFVIVTSFDQTFVLPNFRLNLHRHDYWK